MAPHAVPGRLAAALLVILALGCGDSRVTEPPSDGPAFAKGSGGDVSVTSADPSFGKQGTLGLVVRVVGSGFDDGSRASWEQDGVADAKIKVNSTTFVSSSELRAHIDIAADAKVDLYDIAVYTRGGRKGIGTEKFSVTSAVPLGVVGATSEALGINALGRIVGRYCNTTGCSTGEGAFLWDPVTGPEVLDASGSAFAIDNAGTTIAGADGGVASGKPVVWTGNFGSWSTDTLPNLGSNGAVWGLASDPQGLASLAVGWVQQPTGARLPARWARTGAGWDLTVLSLPNGPTGMLLRDVNALGMAVGYDGTGCCWAGYYDAAGVGQVLPRLNNAASTAWDISEDGLRIAGGSNNRAVVWTRSSSSVAWPLPAILEDTRAICGRNGTSVAFGMNEAGTVVGMSCDEAVAWKPNGSGYQRVRLGSVSACNKDCRARRINDAGTAAGEGSNRAVYWSGS
jgi:hypothetical protein